MDAENRLAPVWFKTLDWAVAGTARGQARRVVFESAGTEHTWALKDLDPTLSADARWNKSTADLSGITWGTDAEKHKIEEDFTGVQQWSKGQYRPILLGEFGAYDRGGADMDSRVRYTSHVPCTAESLGWAFTYWQFDADFIVYDMAKDEWVQPIWRALIPEGTGNR